MTSFKTGSLQKRLLLLVLSAVCVVWILSVALTLIDARHELDEVLDGHLSQVAALLVFQQTHDNSNSDDKSLEAPSLHKYAPKMAFQIFQHGDLVMQSASMGNKAMSALTNGFDTVVLEDGKSWRIFAMDDEKKGIQVYVGESIYSRFYVLKAVLNGMMLPFLLALPVLALLLWWAVRHGLAPLRTLSENLSGRNPHALQALQLGINTPTEIQPMVLALNALFERIETMIVSERRFTSDAAHELRTPIAAIRAQVEVAIGAATNLGEREFALQATLKGCDRAARLVQQLLTLARLEAEALGAGLSQTKTDICGICRYEISELAPQALKQFQVIELSAPATGLIQVDDVLLGVLLRNLIDNALRYSKNGSHVNVVVSQSEAETCLRVEDSGEGMTAVQIARLGERFFRVLGHDQPGSGLGWSIIHRVCKVTDARLDVGKSSQLGGLSVTVSWAHK